MILRGTRIEEPSKLGLHVLALARQGHPGMVSIKRRFRSNAWWPSTKQDVDIICETYLGCHLFVTQCIQSHWSRLPYQRPVARPRYWPVTIDNGMSCEFDKYLDTVTGWPQCNSLRQIANQKGRIGLFLSEWELLEPKAKIGGLKPASLWRTDWSHIPPLLWVRLHIFGRNFPARSFRERKTEQRNWQNKLQTHFRRRVHVLNSNHS